MTEAGRRRTSVRPKQSLGQNFLVDDNIVRKTVRAIAPAETDCFVEIGPGQGALTRFLAPAVRALVLVEIDDRVIDGLAKEFSAPRVRILHEDILETDFSALRREFGSPFRIAGNIPYHLTSPILFRMFDHAGEIVDCTLMIQREVAERLVAVPRTKAYGILSVFTQLFSSPSLLFDVSPNCFYPKPKVVSSVVQLRFERRERRGVDDTVLRTVVRTAFGKRRKTLRNSLAYLPGEESAVADTLASLRFPLDKRPEELTPEEFIDLARSIAPLLGALPPSVGARA